VIKEGRKQNYIYSYKLNLNIETLRGIAIILIVVGHVIGSDTDGGIRADEDSWLRFIYHSYGFIQNPLFVAIAGWVYALKPVNRDNALIFIRKKTRRIILPMITVGAVYFALQSIIPGTNYSYPLNEIWQILIFPYTLYWFLGAIFLNFVLIAVIDYFKLAEKFFNWIMLILFALVLVLVRDFIIPESFPNYFSFKGAIFLFPFFLFGLGFNRFQKQLGSALLIRASFILFVVLFILNELTWFGIVEITFKYRNVWGILLTLVTLNILLRIKYTSLWLVWLGKYAYVIYLFHSFATSGSRILLKIAGVENIPVIFIISLTTGLFFPIMLNHFLKKTELTRFFFLGEARKKTIKPVEI